MIKGRDIVIIGIQPWDIKIGSNCKNLAIEFSKNNRVLYVNQPLDLKTRLLESKSDEVRLRLDVLKGTKNALVEVGENHWTFFPRRTVLSINRIPGRFIYDYLNQKNNEIFAEEIKWAIEELGFENIILFNDSLMFLGYYLKELLDPVIAVYYIRDNLITQPYFKRHGKQMEPELAKKYDVVVSNSTYLANYLKKYNKRSFMVGQGCSLELFNPDNKELKVPDDLLAISKPTIGYIGNLTSIRLDIDLLVYLAETNPDYSFVLIGPEDYHFKNSKLHDLVNVYFLGSKNESELPAYLKGFDVAINPQAINQLTIGNYPRKIDEYLAMGKPTVVTHTETMEYFGDNVYSSKNFEEFSNNITTALKEDSPELIKKRLACASEHTWENNANNIYQVIEQYMRLIRANDQDPCQLDPEV